MAGVTWAEPVVGGRMRTRLRMSIAARKRAQNPAGREQLLLASARGGLARKARITEAERKRVAALGAMGGKACAASTSERAIAGRKARERALREIAARRSHESYVEMGRKGAAKRWSKRGDAQA